MPNIVLETSGLSMRFGGVTAVDNVDFRLRERELRCLIGPNGAGKSTFFKCLAGMLKPSAGQVYFHDQETTGWDPHRITAQGVGVKTQVPSVMDGLSVHENIWLAARRYNSSAQANRLTDETLQRLQLTKISRSLLGQLAHGERQLVELGTVMAAEPSLILLDEPAAGMTGDEVARMREVIQELNRRAAIIVVEHDMQFVQSIAKTVTVFYRGAVLIEDEVDVVMADQRVRDVYLGKQAH